ncbi:hypothetical protein [Aliikangiella maris]|uniref:Uncharacterized protein n=2 Tax=Aliikangiella maris TaxID=3162458 RepID=A0ABV3MUK5_9GAMM
MDFDSLLLKPNLEPLDTNTQRIRRNLLITAIIGIILTIGSANISGNQITLAGIKFENIQILHIYYFLSLTLLYFFIHFNWAVWDNLKENQLRLTGLKIPQAKVAVQAASPIFEPNVHDKRQSTLFSWWKSHCDQYTTFRKKLIDIQRLVDQQHYTAILNQFENLINEMQVKSVFMEHALKQFEEGFWQHQRSQLIRWFLFDFGIPFILGLGSLILLSRKILSALPFNLNF